VDLFHLRHGSGVDEGRLAGLVLAGLFFVAGVVWICLPFHTTGLNANYDQQNMSCRPALLIGWVGTNDSQSAVGQACGGPARERLIFGGGTALLVAGTVTAALVLPRRRTHNNV
jgi:hypothetical protein